MKCTYLNMYIDVMVLRRIHDEVHISGKVSENWSCTLYSEQTVPVLYIISYSMNKINQTLKKSLIKNVYKYSPSLEKPSHSVVYKRIYRYVYIVTISWSKPFSRDGRYLMQWWIEPTFAWIFFSFCPEYLSSRETSGGTGWRQSPPQASMSSNKS